MGVPVGGGHGDSCAYIPQWYGMPEDQLAATIANIIIAVVGVLSLVYYGAHSYLSTCGWEEVYVCVVERKCAEKGIMHFFSSSRHTCMIHVYSSSSSSSTVESYCVASGTSMH
jgi:hypothetical protein